MPTKKADKAKKPERKPAGHTGEKGEALVAWFRSHPKGTTMAEAAEACEATPGRAFEVFKSHPQVVRLGRGVYGWKAAPRAKR